MTDIVFCYQPKDLIPATALMRVLEALGYSVWPDLQVVTAEEYSREIEIRARECKCVVAVAAQKEDFSSSWLAPSVVAQRRKRLVTTSVALVEWGFDVRDPSVQVLIEEVEEFVGRKRARVREDLVSWQVASVLSSKSALRNFIRAFPRSSFATIAQKRLAGEPVNGVFISYRRDSAQAEARLIYERLAAQIGVDNVFFDIATPIGIDFTEHMRRRLKNCSTMVVVIGANWARSADGHADLQDANDFVRQELEMAFGGGLRVLPVLVGATRMPTPEVMPESIRRLAFIQAARLDFGADFDDHMARLLMVVAGR